MDYELCLNSSKDFSITDQKGNQYTVDEAKKIVSGLTSDDTFNCNIAFQRLVLNNYDLEKTREYYQTFGGVLSFAD